MLIPDIRYTRKVIHEGDTVRIELSVYDQTFNLLLDACDFEKVKGLTNRIYVIHNRSPQYAFYQNYPDKRKRRTISSIVSGGKSSNRFYPINGDLFDLRSSNWGRRRTIEVLSLKNPPGIDRRKYATKWNRGEKEMAGSSNPAQQSH